MIVADADEDAVAAGALPQRVAALQVGTAERLLDHQCTRAGRIEHGIGELDVGIGRRADEDDVGRFGHRRGAVLQHDLLVPFTVSAGINGVAGALQSGRIDIGQRHLPAPAARGMGQMISDRSGANDLDSIHHSYSPTNPPATFPFVKPLPS